MIAAWRAAYREITVLARIDRGGTPAYLLRAQPEEGNAHTWTVAAESGLPLALEVITLVPGMGEVGSRTEFHDWRAVGPVKLPFHRPGKVASSLVGRIELRYEALEEDIEPPEGAFSPGGAGH